MRTVTMYEANDGTLYSTEAAALAWEAMLQRVVSALAILELSPKADREFNDRGNEVWTYYQYTPNHMAAFNAAIADLIRDYGSPAAAAKFLVNPFSNVGRLPDPVYNAYFILFRIDEFGRFWEQEFKRNNAMNKPDAIQRIG